MTVRIRFLIVLTAVLLGVLMNVLFISNLPTLADSYELRVKPIATGAEDCTSWDNACILQTALISVPVNGEIWVAAGVHYPGAAGEREATFILQDGVAIYGGFAGTENSRDQRDWVANITVLSGDIDNNDIKDPNGVITNSDYIDGENSYHVVWSVSQGMTSVLDGFTITGGYADGAGEPNWDGAGLYNYDASPTLTNIIFSGNYAYDEGGGMCNKLGSPSLTDIVFINNKASHYGGGMNNLDSPMPTLSRVTFTGNRAGYGGGVFNFDNLVSSTPVFTDVTFRDNTALHSGGGMWNTLASPVFNRVTFFDNSADENGGGMYNESSSSPSLTNVTFSGNSANDYGGGLYNDWSNPSMTNVTFSGNTADQGGGMYITGGFMPVLKNVLIANSIGGDCYNTAGSGISASHSLLEDTGVNACGLSSSGTNITGYDPNLGPLQDNGGATLTHDLLPNSPAIEAGTNTGCPLTDQRGAPRPLDGDGDHDPRCDIGAIEFNMVVRVYLPLVLLDMP
jgi:hypothetical protein